MKRLLVFMMILILSGCVKEEPFVPVIDCDKYPTHKSCTENQIDETIWNPDEYYVEDVYNWIKSNQLPNGLQKSADVAYMVSTYDNALAAITYTMMGDYDRTELIFDFFTDRIQSELNDAYGGFAQFHGLDGSIYGGAIGKRWLGDNAWLLVAVNFYHDKTGTNTYSDLAEGLDSWIRSLQQEDGRLMSGYDEGGTMMGPVTEAMIDAYNAVYGYDQFHMDLLDYLEEERYDATLKVLISWPDNPTYEYAIDMSSWGYLGMNDMPVSVLGVADDKFYMTDDDVEGYCIDEDLDAIWPEHTLQMAVAYITAGSNYYDDAENIIVNMELLMIEEADGYKGLPYATTQATMYGDGPLWDGVDTDRYLSSSAWYLFAIKGVNPFEPGLNDKETNAPDTVFYNQ